MRDLLAKKLARRRRMRRAVRWRDGRGMRGAIRGRDRGRMGGAMRRRHGAGLGRRDRRGLEPLRLQDGEDPRQRLRIDRLHQLRKHRLRRMRHSELHGTPPGLVRAMQKTRRVPALTATPCCKEANPPPEPWQASGIRGCLVSVDRLAAPGGVRAYRIIQRQKPGRKYLGERVFAVRGCRRNGLALALDRSRQTPGIRRQRTSRV